MDLTNTYQKIFKILKEKGATEEQIAKVSEGLAKAANETLYASLISSLTEEDLTALDACQNQEQADQEIIKRYKERTGKDPDQEIQTFLANFAQGFLGEYQKEKTSP